MDKYENFLSRLTDIFYHIQGNKFDFLILKIVWD